MAEFAVNIILRARDEAGPVLDGLVSKSQRLGQNLRGGKGGLLGGKANLGALAGSVNQITGLAKSAISAPIELAANFEAGLNQVNAFSGGVLGATGNLDNISKKARELGASTEFSATESLSAFAVMTQAGFTYEEQMASIGTVMDLATAGNIDLAKSADIVGASLGGFGKDASQATDIADVMAKTATLTQTDVTKMGQAFKTVAPVSKDLGISLRDTSAALGVLGKSGIKGGEAGTSLRAIFGKLAAPTTGNQKRALKALGVSEKDLRKAVESGDIANPLQLLNDAMEKQGIKGTRRTTLLKAFFGERRFGQASLLLESVGKETEGTTRSLKFFQEELAGAGGSLDTMAKTMRSGTKAEAKELSSALEELGITVGQELLPVLKPLIDDAKVAATDFAEWARENPDLVKSLGKLLIAVVAIGTVLGPLLLTLSSLNSLLTLGSAAATLFGKAGMADAIASMVKFSTTASRLNPQITTMIGSKAGFAGMLGAAAAAGAAGFAFGTWLDETFGISDSIAGINTELSIHNDLLAMNLKLQVGRARLRGAAFLGDLTEEEQAQLKAAQKEKEKLSGELAENEESFFEERDRRTLGFLGSDLLGRTDEEINQDLEKQDRIIDSINKKGLARQGLREGKGEGRGGLEAATLGKSAGVDPAVLAAIDQLSTTQLDAGGEVKIVVEDNRVKVKDVKSADIPISVEAGITPEGI